VVQRALHPFQSASVVVGSTHWLRQSSSDGRRMLRPASDGGARRGGVCSLPFASTDMELPMGIEPMVSALPMRCFTAKLRQPGP
jgi:hypothetical protein